jgi:hypothetical protein
MFHSALEQDLKRIFGVQKVLFCKPSIEKEKSFFCWVEKSRIRKTAEGKAFGTVNGYIAIIGQNAENPSWFFQRRIEKADRLILNRFSFSSIENNIEIESFDKSFNGFYVEWTYFYSQEYDPIRYKIAGVDFIFNVIKKFFN